jgi:hypothetical protein
MVDSEQKMGAHQQTTLKLDESHIMTVVVCAASIKATVSEA